MALKKPTTLRRISVEEQQTMLRRTEMIGGKWKGVYYQSFVYDLQMWWTSTLLYNFIRPMLLMLFVPDAYWPTYKMKVLDDNNKFRAPLLQKLFPLYKRDENGNIVTETITSSGHRLLNRRAAIWHFMLWVLIVIVWMLKDPPFFLTLNRMWAKPVFNETLAPFLFNTTCSADGVDYVATGRSIFDWFDCVRPQSEQWRETTKIQNIELYQPSKEFVFEFEVIWLVWLFEIITWGLHYIVYANDEFYHELIKNELAPFRWSEYAVTASLMFTAALSLSRVSDMYLLIALFLCSVSLNWVRFVLFL